MLDRRPFLVSLIVSCGKADVQNAWFSGFPFMAHNDLVSVTMVTYNSGRFIRRCLESVLDQDYHNYEVIVVDNASSDGTADILEQFEERCRIYYNQQNIGFAAAQNQAIGLSGGDWVLTLNPDVLLLQGFIRQLVEAAQWDERIGTVCGKLLAMSPHFEIPRNAIVDSTGIFFNPMLRHLDRGSREVDNGHYLDYEFVFGATAAAALYRRTMIDDISIAGEFFDSDFFVYREDADVAWRAQLMGWKCLYVPYARGYHVRKVLPGNRRALPPEINMHSVKNRFLMRAKNISADLYRRNWFSITLRDVVVVACCLIREHTSLKAFWHLAKTWKRVLAKRRAIQARRCVDDEYIASWFRYNPVSRKVPERAAAVGRSAPPESGAARVVGR
jgi:GT2 family glycosyltransferase